MKRETAGSVEKTQQTEVAKRPKRPKKIKEQREKIELKGRANAPHTIADALRATEKFLGPNLTWELRREFKALESKIPKFRAQLPKLADVIKSIAQKGGVDKINHFLKENGFSIRLKDPGNEMAISAASVLKMPVTWHNSHEAVKKTISIRSRISDRWKEVPAVTMINVKDIYEIPNHDHPIVRLKTNSNDTVYITKYDKPPPKDSMGLHQLASKWQKQIKPSAKKTIGSVPKYNGEVTFPMVDFQRSGDITELLGASPKEKGLVVIDQAKYEHILKMNEKGAVAKAASALMLKLRGGGGGPIPVHIDGPFMVWFERKGIIPFTAYITENDMKAPKDLK